MRKIGIFLVAAADGAEDLQRGALVELVVAFKIPVQQDGGVGGVGGDEREAVLGRGGADDFVAFFGDGVDQALHGAVGDGVGAADLGCDQ